MHFLMKNYWSMHTFMVLLLRELQNDSFVFMGGKVLAEWGVHFLLQKGRNVV